MVEQGTRVDRLVSIDIAERFEALQDEVDLLKNEIKQTLIDLREHMMKGRTVFSQTEEEERLRISSPLPARVVYAREPPVSTNGINGRRSTAPAGQSAPGPRADGMDPMMLANVIDWLGTVKRMGLSLQQVTPFLEAYEASGYLPPIMLKVLLRSLADLDQLAYTPQEVEFSPEQYADCIGQLHDIICAVEVVSEQAVGIMEGYSAMRQDELPRNMPGNLSGNLPENHRANLLENLEEVRIEAEPLGNGKPNIKKNSHGSADSDTSNYNIRTIQVPESHDGREISEYGGPVG
ncbi:MAG: hypothetical protein O3A93_07040 [Chloroflexi bacterium]|nr:hypothetical protein [Chloroflexota bacterium]MDA1270999.1 hypothetical protein [Chloroflexota bacterium]PKB58253.1 MAG: hypothetical protein BZY83_08005 [SAR202 cluster bacterium Casp-Chloro-G2]